MTTTVTLTDKLAAALRDARAHLNGGADKPDAAHFARTFEAATEALAEYDRKVEADRQSLLIAGAGELVDSIREQARAGQYLEADDTAFFLSRNIDREVRERILIERAIVRRAVIDILAEGHSITVYHEDQESDAVRSTDLTAIMLELCACDMEGLAVYRADEVGRWGWLTLIYGNDGWDVMNDHSLSLTAVLAGASELADAIGDHL